MKKIIIYISLLALLLGTGSCDDFLIRGPIDQIGEVDFFKNTDEVNQGVMACYNGMQDPTDVEWYLTELRSDNSRGNSPTAQSLSDIFLLDMFKAYPAHTTINTYWEAVYHNISRCNKVLKYLNVVDDATLKKQYEGEAMFIRSYHYFSLVRLFGPVFKVTSNITYEEAAKYERSSVDDIYSFIIEDLSKIIDANEPLLPETYESSQKGRVDIWAAKTLLAKVYLTLGRYSDALPLLEDVRDHSGYKLLTSSYADVFSVSNEMNDEIIFTVRYKAGGYGLGSRFANEFAPGNSYTAVITGGGDGRNTPTEDLVRAYESGDKRKDVTMAYSWVNPSNVTVYVSYVKKFLAPVLTKYDGENDWPILRFADVLLMLGEVENELSGASAGLPYLNQIRNRAGLPSLTSAQITNKVEFRLAMEKERRVEFAFENQRLFDLLRTKRIVPVMKNHFLTEDYRDQGNGTVTSYYQKSTYQNTYLPNTDLEEWQFILPIPSRVLEQSTLATQNPGY